MKRPLFFANWKMNHGPTEARAYVAAFLRFFAPHDDRTVALFPPALSLTSAREARADRTDILLGAQNIFTRDKGAFTGENSAPMARDAGAELVLVGHSERRHIFGESNLDTAQKVAIAEWFGLTPVLCVGETLDQRKTGAAEAIVIQQLEDGLARREKSKTSPLAIAYEPVWAIGTGLSATPDDASTMHKVIREKLHSLAIDGAEKIPVLYGGSVSKKNCEALLSAEGVDGLLVGSSCLDPEAWAEICRT
ncbi:MAG TPA: triose-phosphate isomerase [Gemmatimonadaceae bacterium]|nr:triose-phosphate isomerase [Gemmatimonadaceae bacterium]